MSAPTRAIEAPHSRWSTPYYGGRALRTLDKRSRGAGLSGRSGRDLSFNPVLWVPASELSSQPGTGMAPWPSRSTL